MTSRREFLHAFLRSAGCYAVTAAIAPLRTWAQPLAVPGDFQFPQGVASADPQADAIVLWTRVVQGSQRPDSIDLRVQVARDEAFDEVLVEQNVVAERTNDYTVRCFVDGLQADRRYFFRFLAPDDGVSRLGRTRTAPQGDAKEPLRVAVCSCQHYGEGFFSAYRRILLDDAEASSDAKIDLILHVGDYIYETFPGTATSLDGGAVELAYADGSLRGMAPFPSGAERRAETLDDYRLLYRTYLSDPDLQDARAWFPFVHTWDDHELLNDYWQSYTPTASLQRQKVDSNQAWFEYIPAALSRSPVGPSGVNLARDFVRPEVEDSPLGELDDDYLSREPNNLSAINSMTIYRSLRWGSVVDLLLVDGRSYRGERGLDATILGTEEIAYPALPVPPELVETLNAGRNANDGSPPETVEFDGRSTPNPRRNSPRGSMLGAPQKAWLKESLLESDATWKVIGNNVPMMRFGFDIAYRDGGGNNDIWWTDNWDGYPLERRELMEFIRDQRLANVVSLTGDRHAHFAGVVMDDFDRDGSRAIMPEFAGASVSATCRLIIQGRIARGDPTLLDRIRFDGPESGFDQGMMATLNAWLLYGGDSAKQLHDTADVEAAERAANPSVNPHLAYADTDAYGYFVARFGPDMLETEFVVIPEPHTDYGRAGPPVRRRVCFTVPAWSAGAEPMISNVSVVGDPPLLGLKERGG